MNPRRVLSLLCILSIITYLDRVCISVAGPRMQESLHIGPDQWGWVTGVFALAYGAFEIPSGALGDRIGPRRVLTRIVLWWSAFTSLTGLVSSYYLLLITRFCFGMGEAGAYPNANVVIGRWFPGHRRGRAMGIMWMSSQLGGAVAPLLVVPLQQRYGWRASFYLFGLLGVGWATVWYRWFRDSPEGSEPVEHHGLPWRAVVRSGNLWAVMGMTACYVYTLYFFQSWFHTYLVEGRGYNENDLMLSAVPYLVGACGNAGGGFASDALVSRLGLTWGRRTAGIIGLSVSALFTVATLATSDKLLAVVFLAIVYGGITFQQPTVFAVCLDIGKRNAGAITGAMNTAGQVGSFVSSLAFGYLVKSSGDYNLPLIPMAVLLVGGALLWLKIDASRAVAVQ